MTKHALYVTCDTKHGSLTFRVGQPTDVHTAHNRWQRIADRAQGFNVPQRMVTVKHDGRSYPIRPVMCEVRSTDKHGRGLGADRHTLAFPVPFRNLRSAL